MADEVIIQQGDAAGAGTPTAPTPPPAPSPEDLRDAAFKWLNEAAPEEILRNNRLGGILGQRMNTAREQIRREEAEANAERIRQQTQEEFAKLANEDPAEFSRRYLSQMEQDRIRNQQYQLMESTQREFASSIGDAFQALAEWKELTPEEFKSLQDAVAGKTGKDVVGAFAVTAANIVAERKASKKMTEYRAKELDKEREAIRSEEAAKLLQGSERPDLANGASTQSRFDPTKLSQKDFDAWYRSNFLGRV